MADDDLHPLPDVGELHGSRLLVGAIKRNPTVHDRWLDLVFLAINSDKGLPICRHKKIWWKNSIRGRRCELGVAFVLNLCPMLAQTQDQIV